MPLAIMEAMAKGLPVAATAISGIPEELGVTGKLLPDGQSARPRLVAELAATLVRWSGDAVLRAEVGVAARSRAETMFREERMVEQTRALIDAVLSALEKPKPLAATA
jgi:glycosyltransferase involved in cell wall biosynthesis